MGRGREARYVSDRDEFEGTRGGVFRNANQYGQSGIDVLELRTMDRDGEAGCASNGDVFEGAGGGASRYANQYE